MLELKELKDLQDKGYNYNTVTREAGSDDLVFYWITQWDDNLLGESQLQYRGEFNIIRKAGRQIVSDLRSNPIQINFEPTSDSRDDGADLLDGLYLTDDRKNTTLESYDNAVGEAVVCGIGAWEMVTEYQSNRAGNKTQVIKRKPIYEANNTCFFDPNAKLLDKSDADWASILTSYSNNGYVKLVKEMTGEDIEGYGCGSSFSQPEQSYTFPWAGGDTEHIYVVTFYHREIVKDNIITLSDPFGSDLLLRESDLEDVMDELMESGYEITDTREIERPQVTKYVASGESILNGDGEGEVIAGPNIPITPTYGERAFVEGNEHYEGITRLAKDPQRLRNFQLSYLTDIVSNSPRPKPIFFPEQIKKFEFMYEENGADNQFPYYLQNSKDPNGNPLPIGPVSVMPEQTMPTALMAAVDLSRQAVEDVANPGLPQDIADPDLSGKAVLALQNRLDQQSLVYQQNLKHAKRRDAEIYAGMAVEIVDTPRKVTITKKDGTTDTIEVMEVVIDSETGEPVVLNDLTNMEFDVYAEIGQSYNSKKDQTIEKINEMKQGMIPGDPMFRMLTLKQVELVDGVNFDNVREYARKQQIIEGFQEPETDEEIAMMEQMSQTQEPSADMVLAQAENKKGDAAIMREQTARAKVQGDQINNQAKNQIDSFEAETGRMSVQVDAQKAGAEINFKNIQAFGKKLENASVVGEARGNIYRASVSG